MQVPLAIADGWNAARKVCSVSIYHIATRLGGNGCECRHCLQPAKCETAKGLECKRIKKFWHGACEYIRETSFWHSGVNEDGKGHCTGIGGRRGACHGCDPAGQRGRCDLQQ